MLLFIQSAFAAPCYFGECSEIAPEQPSPPRNKKTNSTNPPFVININNKCKRKCVTKINNMVIDKINLSCKNFNKACVNRSKKVSQKYFAYINQNAKHTKTTKVINISLPLDKTNINTHVNQFKLVKNKSYQINETIFYRTKRYQNKWDFDKLNRQSFYKNKY